MSKWTIKELNKISDIDFCIAILNERQNKLTNPYSPLYIKISSVKNSLCKIGRKLGI